jgi:hypothetical protein
MQKPKIEHMSDLTRVKVLEDEELLAWIGYIWNEASPTTKGILEKLDLAEKRSEYIHPCFVDLKGLALDSLTNGLRNQDVVPLNLREYVSLTSTLDQESNVSRDHVFVYGGEFEKYYDTDTRRALMFAFAKPAIEKESGFWFSDIAFVEYQNYFLMNDNDAWLTCKHITEY